MKILVNKCPDTGELFESDSKYRAHRRQILAEQKAKQKRIDRAKEISDWLAAEKEKIVAVDMIVPWILKEQETLMAYTNEVGRFSFNDKFHKGDVIEKIEISLPRWNNLVSNAHECPHNGVTNWGGRIEGAPRGYPGWQGYIKGKLKRERQHMGDYPMSALLDFVGLKSGTGGGGNDDWGYDLKIFLADWPGLEQELLVNKLLNLKK